MRIRRTAVVLGTAAALAVVPVGTGVAQAGTTVAFNDSSSSFKVGENYRDYTLPAGRTSRGWLGLHPGRRQGRPRQVVHLLTSGLTKLSVGQ
jgi:hypothetical protein